MPYRFFVDSRGVRWRVWDVVPTLLDRRHHIRRVRVVRFHQPERRVLPTRRVDMARSRLFFPPTESGWLCFESDSERFRLKPIPPSWAAADDSELERLRDDANARAAGSRAG